MTKPGTLSNNPRGTPYKDGGIHTIFGTRRADSSGDLDGTKKPKYGTIPAGGDLVVGPLIEGQIYRFIFADATTPQSATPQAVRYRASANGAATDADDGIWPCHLPGKAVFMDGPVRIRDGEPYYTFYGLGTTVFLTVQRCL